MTAPLVDIACYNPRATDFSIARVPIELAKASAVPFGFRYPVEHATRRPISGMVRYLLDIAEVGGRNRTGVFNAETNRTYANLLKPGAEALVLEGRPYEYLDDDIVDLVVQSMVDGVTRRGRPFAGGTISAVVSAIDRCVAHTNKKGLTSIAFDRDEALAKAWRVDSIYDRDGKPLPRATLEGKRQHMIRPLGKPTADLILGRLVEPAAWTRLTGSSRPAVTFMNGRRIGLRLVENLGIHVEDVRRLNVIDPDVEYEFTIRRTKGADRRDVIVEGRELLVWQKYDVLERAECVKAARDEYGSNNYDEPAGLLVNGLRSGAGLVGQATQPSTIQRDFRVVLRALGMFTTVELPSPDGGVQEVDVYWHCYHDLRHTAAMEYYDVALLRGGDAARDPVAFVQFRLGHAHRTTTERIYLFPDRRRRALVGDMGVEVTRAIGRG